jgi:hypothetical protein
VHCSCVCHSHKKMVMPLMIPVVIGIYILASATVSFARKMIYTKKGINIDPQALQCSGVSTQMSNAVCCGEHALEQLTHAQVPIHEFLCAQDTIELKPGEVGHIYAYVNKNKNNTTFSASLAHTSIVCTEHDGSCGDTFHHLHARVIALDGHLQRPRGFKLVPVSITNLQSKNLYVEEGDVLGHVLHYPSPSIYN